ncbi:MAG: DUF1446 domain-containing protein [Desulfarculus sp.]|nr:DUF1446 domain-containing protein [Desulfarculus sp.]
MTLRIGSGAGYSGDRIEPAVELAQSGRLDYLAFECLAERTIAIDQQKRLKNPEEGYDPLLEARMRAVLPICLEKGVRIITNMGAANPLSALAKVAAICREMGLGPVRLAAVTGDDVLDQVRQRDLILEETGQPASALGSRLVSANAYLGAAPMVEALRRGAQVVVTGRVADPALFLAPMIHHFNWGMDDWSRLGQGTIIGHLLECAGQITGGYFADPGCKDVAGLARLGFPLAEVEPDGSAVITKVEGSGGRITLATCKEQMLYELHDPAAYLTPDVTADFSGVRFTDLGNDRVGVGGGTGRVKPPTLKVCVGYVDSYIGEGQIGYAGPGALDRARLGAEIVRERLKLTGVRHSELRVDYIGLDSLHGPGLSRPATQPYEVRLRVAGRTETPAEAERIGNEVETLYTNGPAAGGGVTKGVRQVLAMASAYLPREAVQPELHIQEVPR